MDHIKSNLCDGTPEWCSDPKHLDYDEMRSTIKQAIDEAEKIAPGSSDERFKITKHERLLAPYNVNEDLKLQILYQKILLIKSEFIDTKLNDTKSIDITIGLFHPSDRPPIKELFCHGDSCFNEGERDKATHALQCPLKDLKNTIGMSKGHKNAIGVICLLCPLDYLMSIKNHKHLEKAAIVCLNYDERQELR